jgi:REP element-mobilizing transposase RayT
MVVGYHLIWTAYGWWLPNDPRGSSSHEIRVERIAGLGELHQGRRAVQPGSLILRQFYERARGVLKHPLLTLSPSDVDAVAEAFGGVVAGENYTCYACAIMPDHVHALIRKHRDKSEAMLARLQDASRKRLVAVGARGPDHPVWGGPGWKVYLNTEADMTRIVKYIRSNPIKAGLPGQRWGFVTEYDGWMPRPARET